MHCPIYNATMRSKNCLEYQARARGESLPKKSIYSHPSDGSVLWEIKYKPCLTCETGREIRENGGDDSDVEAKIAQANGAADRQLKRCNHCKLEKPPADFSRNRTNKDGLQNSCRSCSAEIQKKSYQKLKQGKNMTVTADHVAEQRNMVVDIPEGLNELARPIPKTRTCTRCGWTGPEKSFHMAGSNGHINICRMCVSKRRQQAAAKLVTLPDHGVIVDFAEYPELLETLRQTAKANFRTLENEILFRVVNYGK